MNLSDFTEYGMEIIKDSSFGRPKLQVGTQSEYGLLVFALNSLYFERAYKDDHVSAIICSSEIENIPMDPVKGIAISDNPREVFYSIHNFLIESDQNYCGYLTEPTFIDSGTVIAFSAGIADFGVRIGKGCVIEENVLIRSGVSIKDGTIVRAGAIIGCDNNINYRNSMGQLCRVKSAGDVVIGEKCEIGYYSTIARGWFSGESTVIKDHVFLGCRSTIGHNVEIGSNTDIKDMAQVCGYTVVGDNCHIAPQCVISNKLRIGNDSNVTLGSVVVNNLKNRAEVSGNYAIDKDKFLRWHLKKLKER